MDSQEISLDEMGEFEGALLYTLALAQRWDQLVIPDDLHVMVANCHIEDNEIVEAGIALAGPRADPAQGLLLADCTIDGCSVAVVADHIIDMANSAVRDALQ